MSAEFTDIFTSSCSCIKRPLCCAARVTLFVTMTFGSDVSYVYVLIGKPFSHI